MTNWSSWL